MGSPALEIETRQAGAEAEAGRRLLTLVTWNVWRDAYRFDERARGLFSILREQDADLVCLHDVCSDLRARLLAADWVRDRYWLADFAGSTDEPFGTMLLSREPLHRIKLAVPPELEGRVLHGAIRVHGRSVAICGLHARHGQRRALENVLEQLASLPEVIVCGCIEDDVDPAETKPELSDTWRELRGAHPGYTLDTVRNATAARLRPRDEQARHDRVLTSSRSGVVRPRTIDLLGTEPVSPTYDLYVSDHLGLRATFALSA